MKRLRMLFAALLVAALVLPAVGFARSEGAGEEAPWQADILKLMDPGKAPKSTSVHFERDLPEDVGIPRRSYNQELVSSRGDVLNVEFKFAMTDGELGDGQWATLTDWLKALVLSAVQNVKADSESLAGVIAEGYRADLVVLDIDKPHFYPQGQMVNHLVYSANSGDIVMTICDGNIVYDHGKFPTIDMEKALFAMERDFRTVLEQL